MGRVECSGRAGPSAGAIAGAAVRAGARDGAVCPNLLQRPGSGRNAGRETLIFRASSRRRSRPGAPLQQIRTRPRPGSPIPAITPFPAGPGNFPVRRSRCASSGREECDGERKARAGHLFRAAGPLTHRFTRVRYALLPLLRLFTLHCTRRRSAAEGEGAQQTIRRGLPRTPGPQARSPAAPPRQGTRPGTRPTLLPSSEKDPPALRPAPGKRTRTPL